MPYHVKYTTRHPGSKRPLHHWMNLVNPEAENVEVNGVEMVTVPAVKGRHRAPHLSFKDAFRLWFVLKEVSGSDATVTIVRA